jgi:3-(3-hydroxy-phenyl)propionate hydroxylase
MTGGGRAAGVLRTTVLAAVRRIPAVARLATDSRTPPLRGPLVDRHGRAGRRLAGTLVPQPEVVVDGHRRRLDDVLGDGAAELTADLDVRRADGTVVRVEDPSGTLTAWLRGASVCIRPDRIVGSAGDRPAA